MTPRLFPLVLALGCALADPAAAQRGDDLRALARIDHVMVLVRDLDASAKTFRERLGFADFRVGPTPVDSALGATTMPRTKSSISILPDESYLELVAVGSRTPSDAPPMRVRAAEFLRTHQSAFVIGLGTASAKRLIASLNARGIATAGPLPGRPLRSTDTLWWTVHLPAGTLPGDPIFFMENDPAFGREFVSAKDAAGLRRHTNGAQGVASVWLVVRNLSRAAEAFESIGFHADSAVRQLPGLGGTAREIALERGSIVLVEPTQGTDAAARFMEDRGEGVMGVSIAVADTARTSAVLTANGVPLVKGPGPKGGRLLVPASAASGLWLEFLQR